MNGIDQRAPPGRRSAHSTSWQLRLYVAGPTDKCQAAIANLQRICRERLDARCTFEVVDLLEHPELARGDHVLAIPTLVRKQPLPVKRIVGDLADEALVLAGLELHLPGARGLHDDET